MNNKITMTEAEALEMALEVVESMYELWCLMIRKGEDWVCIISDEEVEIAREGQELDIDLDAKKILFKWQIWKLVEEHFEFKRKSNLSKS